MMAGNSKHATTGSEYELHYSDTTQLVPSYARLDKPIKRQLSKREVAKLRWLPWLVFAFAVNIFFFLSMLYALLAIDTYENNKLLYFLTAWGIFLIPSIIVAILVMTPYPRSFRRFRHKWSDKEPSPNFAPGTNFVSAICCLISVVLYLYIVAIPQYNNSVWTSEVHYSSNLPLPAFAVIYWNNATKPISLTQTQRDSGEFPTCVITNSTSLTNFDCSSYMQTTTILNRTAVVFDPTTLPIDHSSFKDLQSYVFMYAYANYDSRETNTNDSSAFPLTIDTTFFDPRMDHSVLGQCGLVGTATLPAFAITYADIELTETTDAFELLHDPSRPKACAEAHSRLLSEPSPYKSWSWALNTMSLTDINSCDVSNNPDAMCPTVIGVSYGTKMTTDASSGPGISKLDIWINAGSIVGGVQFFFWFLTLFSAY